MHLLIIFMNVLSRVELLRLLIHRDTAVDVKLFTLYCAIPSYVTLGNVYTFDADDMFCLFRHINLKRSRASGNF